MSNLINGYLSMIETQTPEQQLFEMLLELRRTSNHIRRIVDQSMHGRIRSLTQHMIPSLIQEQIQISGSGWMLPYFNGAKNFMVGLLEMKQKDNTDAIVHGMRVYKALEIVQVYAVATVAEIVAVHDASLIFPGIINEAHSIIIELYAMRVIEAMKIHQSASARSIHLHGLSVLMHSTRALNRATSLFTAIDVSIAVFTDVMLASLRLYADDVEVQVAAFKAFQSMIIYNPSFHVAIKQRGVTVAAINTLIFGMHRPHFLPVSHEINNLLALPLIEVQRTINM